MFLRIFFWFFLFIVLLSTGWYLFAVFLTVFRKVSRFRSFFRRFLIFHCFLNVSSNFLSVFLVTCPIVYRMVPFSGFMTVFRKVSRYRSFFRCFLSVFGVLCFFHCFLKVASNFLSVFPVTCPILYRMVPFSWFFNCFSQN